MIRLPKSKYRNKKTVVDGIMFDSKLEAEYYLHLKLMLKCEKILDFEMQKRCYCRMVTLDRQQELKCDQSFMLWIS